MQDENDHVQWLRKQGQALRQSSEKAADEKQKAKMAKTAERMFAAANAFELVLAGTEPGAMGGHIGLQKRLLQGQQVYVRFMNGAGLRGVIAAMGKYDFALTDLDGRELVVPKHAVQYWELVGEAGVEEE